MPLRVLASALTFAALLLLTSGASAQGAEGINTLLSDSEAVGSSQSSNKGAQKEGLSAFDRSAKHGIQILADYGRDADNCYSDLLLNQIAERRVHHLYKPEAIVFTPNLCRISFVNVSRSNQIEVVVDRLAEPFLVSPISTLFTGFVLDPDSQLDILINPHASWRSLQTTANVVNILGDTTADLNDIKFAITFEGNNDDS